jgi:tellurite resistance protein TerC
LDFLFEPVLGKPALMWIAAIGVVISLLAIDLGLCHRKSREIGVKESLGMTAFYVLAGLAFGVWVWAELGSQAGTEYMTGFLVEKTLAMDNIFVISLIFAFFAIPPVYQHRVLFWGILGVIVLRAIMIGVGATLVAQYSWILYIFAAFLIITGIKMLLVGESEPDIANIPALKFLRKRMRITGTLHQEKFFVHLPDPATGRVVAWATPLFAALVLIEIVDLIFAVDSIPAIFAITTDPFVVYTSNIFAILGLRALYFALAAVLNRFKYLKQALALVLVFIGSKIFIADMLGWSKFPASLSLAVTLAIISAGVAYSLYRTAQERNACA